MSFLVTEDDTSILSEAFAFIDEACSGGSSPAGLESTDGDSGLDAIPSLNILEVNEEGAKDNRREPKQKPARKRRVRSAETSSTGLQRRKRAELASLREQAQELEGVLVQMQRGVVAGPLTERASEERDSRRCEWYRHALEQCQLRLQAEKTNRQLKSILKKQAKVHEALNGVLQKRSTLYHKQSSPSINSSVVCNYDQRRQTKVVEFETTTPLGCSLQDATAFVWRNFQIDRVRSFHPNTLLKKVVITMPSRNGAIQAEKLNYVRKHEDGDQTLISWADLMVLPTKSELHFRAEGLILLTPSQADPKQTLLRSFLKLYLDNNSASLYVGPEDIAYAQDIVLGAMAAKIRMFWQSFQNMLIEEAGPASSDAFSVAYPDTRSPLGDI
ncbi:hypothetical protein PHYSODRAFT_525783 [Phytophthora sojae]|uniref:M96 mating-specific protein family n=1 Tax=Phytophthora sojae (strain P6497) TaxID=1094619 RepID=G5A6X1_PHYSP|nr:hypothetical protein PHYSODRAFT_525783 [Phytophthora sojae]EGZ09076.1 hypothetical protein PHYSODRAFT_525783 [Phytophthora sojae]|eukprot:XP_009535709.1 hypothetical protein PHYSODRAFT_525783 [Phytophthora sojae]